MASDEDPRAAARRIVEQVLADREEQVLADREEQVLADREERAPVVDAAEVPGAHDAPDDGELLFADRDEAPAVEPELAEAEVPEPELTEAEPVAVEPEVTDEDVSPERRRARELVAETLAEAEAREAAEREAAEAAAREEEAAVRLAAAEEAERVRREAERARRVAAEQAAAERRLAALASATGATNVGDGAGDVAPPADGPEAAPVLDPTAPLSVAELAAAQRSARPDVETPADPAGTTALLIDPAAETVATSRSEVEAAAGNGMPRVLEATVEVPPHQHEHRKTGRWLLASVLGALALAVLFPLAVDALRSLVSLS